MRIVTRLAAALILAAALLGPGIARPAPVAAFVANTTLYAGTGGGGAGSCGITTWKPTLTSLCSANWDNRAYSVKVQLISGQCASYYVNASYGGASQSVFGTGDGTPVYTVNLAAGIAGAVSSLRIPGSTYTTPYGVSYCQF